ncbi:MAG TPA: hypothetical protein VGQ69_03255 [Gemmatimonadales bacterium]|jgi:hypothetical protein|nr:hypothetical protein [Gemmatimonadales bacterium]
MIITPPPVVAPAAQALPPLSFLRFRAGMPVSEAGSLIRASRGILVCKATSDSRMRECTGRLPRPGLSTVFEVLISSVHDSSAVIVFSLRGGAGVSRWVTDLTRQFGRPNHRQQGNQSSWQWIRDRKMLRVVERRTGGTRETSVTLTHGPLLDGLGAPQGTP